MQRRLDPWNRRKVDVKVMQQANRALVLNLVRSDPTLSRAAIARLTGLSGGAVSAIVDYLVREGLIRESDPTATGNVGRRPLRLSFEASARLAVGISVDIQDVRAALVDLGGTPRTVYRELVPPGAGPVAVLDIASRLAHRAMRNVPPQHILGVGMAIPGIVSWPEGINLFSPNYGWRDVPVRAMMEQRLDTRVVVDNEVRALALAEQQFGAAQGTHTGIFFDVGFGVGGAVITDGELYRGAHGGAGEIGHNTVEIDGPLCGCGNRGCLEVYASTHGMVARTREALAAGRSSSLAIPPEELTFEDVLAEAHAGDELCTEILHRAATYLGVVVANAIDNWDPEIVVLGGTVIDVAMGIFEELLAMEQRSVIETAQSRVRLMRAGLGDNSKIIGAAYAVIADYLAGPLQSRASGPPFIGAVGSVGGFGEASERASSS